MSFYQRYQAFFIYVIGLVLLFFWVLGVIYFCMLVGYYYETFTNSSLGYSYDGF